MKRAVEENVTVFDIDDYADFLQQWHGPNPNLLPLRIIQGLNLDMAYKLLIHFTSDCEVNDASFRNIPKTFSVQNMRCLLYVYLLKKKKYVNWDCVPFTLACIRKAYFFLQQIKVSD